MTFTRLSPTEGSASVARCDPDVGSESESGMMADGDDNSVVGP